MSTATANKVATVWSMPISLQDETKNFDFNAKKGILSGYMTLFNSPITGLPYVDTYLDVVEPGLCTKTIQELQQGMKYKNLDYLLPYLWQHKSEEMIGGVKHLGEDSKGVTFENHLARGVQRAEEALILLDQKMMAGISYGYDPIRYLPQNGRRHLKEIRLHELSQVTFPAHEFAAVNEIKAWADAYYKDGRRLYPGFSAANNSGNTKQARDFNTIWQNRQADETMHELFMIGDVLQSSLIEGLSEAGADANSVVAAMVSQAQAKLQSWAQDFQLSMNNPYVARDGTQLDMNEMMGYMGLDTSVFSLKQATGHLFKEGRKISAARRKRLENALQTLTDHMKDIQAILDETEPPAQNGKARAGENNTQGAMKLAPDAKPWERMDAWFSTAGVAPPDNTTTLAPLATTEAASFLAEMRETLSQFKKGST